MSISFRDRKTRTQSHVAVSLARFEEENQVPNCHIFLLNCSHESPITKRGLLETADYDRLNTNLRMMFGPKREEPQQELKDPFGGAPSSGESLLELNQPLFSDDPSTSTFRYQNVTRENYGYVGQSIDVKPYGIAKFTFVAQFDNELGVNQGIKDMYYYEPTLQNFGKRKQAFLTFRKNLQTPKISNNFLQRSAAFNN